jgi:hypothetical protein
MVEQRRMSRTDGKDMSEGEGRKLIYRRWGFVNADVGGKIGERN